MDEGSEEIRTAERDDAVLQQISKLKEYNKVTNIFYTKRDYS